MRKERILWLRERSNLLGANGRHIKVRLVAVGFRHVNDDFRAGMTLGVGLVLDGGEGAEEQVADVGEDGGAACSDAVLGKKAEEIGEDLIEVGRGLELGELAEEGDGEVGLLETDRARVDVFGAETGGDIGDSVAATAAGAGAVLTTGQVIGEAGVDGLFVHQLNGGTVIDGLFIHGDPRL